LEDLLEAILLVADSIEIRANPNGKVFGTVIEAELDKTKGTIATLLVQNGSIQMGDVVLAGKAYGRIRAMFDFRSKKIVKAKPSTPVLVMGLNGVPEAGELFQVYNSERDAKAVAEERKTKEQEKLAAVPKATLEELFTRYKAGETQELRLIIKADVQGSLEPIRSSLKDLDSGDIKINILYSETGNITDNDVLLAAASRAIIVGFNVQADANAHRLAEGEGVSIRQYDIIYRLIEDVEKALKGMLAPEFKEVSFGKADVRAVFHISKVGNIAGCKIREGEIHRNKKVRVLRGDKVLYEGEIASLKHEKDDVNEVRTGWECGIGMKGFNEFAAGDVIECYTLERVI
jgi:translation initiation factor IF-2